MARARSLKPGYFTNEGLADLGPHAHLLFAGLWTLADRKGRLEDRPRRIKVQALPFYDVDVDGLLTSLASAGFIVRYERDDNKYIQINNFDKHQNPHIKEAESAIPAPDKHRLSTGNTGTSTGDSGTRMPDSLNPITDSLNPLPEDGADAPADMDEKAWIRFVDYRKQIRKPLKPASILAAQRKLAAFGTDQAAVVEQTIANGWQGLFDLKTLHRAGVSTQPSRTMQSLQVLEGKKRGCA